MDLFNLIITITGAIAGASAILWLVPILPRKTISGGSQLTTGKFIYHGSSKEYRVLSPRPSRVIDGESAVFATPSYISAVIFGSFWTDVHFEFGSVNGKKYLTERYPGAFDKLDCTCYVHYLDAAMFCADSRLPPSELICPTEVPVLRCDAVNCREYLAQDASVRMIYWKNPHEFQQIIGLPKSLIHKIHTLYMLVDPVNSYDDIIPPSADTTINFDRIDPAELPNMIKKKYSKIQKSKNRHSHATEVLSLVGDPVDLYRSQIRFAKIRQRIIVQNQAYNPQQKVTREEYDRFVSARLALLSTIAT